MKQFEEDNEIYQKFIVILVKQIKFYDGRLK